MIGLAAVNTTPEPVTVEKSGAPISVLCEKEGYLDSEGTVKSKFQSMTLGNILFGGIVGMAVDAGSGAMHEYEPSVSISLVPDVFETVGQRDAFFDKMRDSFLVQSDETIERISKQCFEDSCVAQLKAANEAKDTKLADIELQRQLVRIVAAPGAGDTAQAK